MKYELFMDPIVSLLNCVWCVVTVTFIAFVIVILSIPALVYMTQLVYRSLLLFEKIPRMLSR